MICEEAIAIPFFNYYFYLSGHGGVGWSSPASSHTMMAVIAQQQVFYI